MAALQVSGARLPRNTQKAPGRYTAERLHSFTALRAGGFPRQSRYSGSFAKTMFTASSAEISPFSNPTLPCIHGRIDLLTAPS